MKNHACNWRSFAVWMPNATAHFDCVEEEGTSVRASAAGCGLDRAASESLTEPDLKFAKNSRKKEGDVINAPPPRGS